MTVLTVELRNPDGSVMNTIRFSDADKKWYDIDPQNSPLNTPQGIVDDTAYGQFRCMAGGSEVLRLVNIDWNIPATRHGDAFCYGCKIGFTHNPQWFCTAVS